MITDPIADYLTRIRNGNLAGHRVVEIPSSNLKKEITKILFDQGYILSYKFHYLCIHLRLCDKHWVFQQMHPV